MWPRLVGGLALHCGDQMVAEELAQETLVRLWQHWDRLDDTGSVDAWVWTVALNLSRSKRRRWAAARRAQARLGPATDLRQDPDPATVVAIRRAVATLPDRQRMAVALRYFADLPVKDVAVIMGCAEGTVSAHTHQALKSLGDQLRDEIVEGIVTHE